MWDIGFMLWRIGDILDIDAQLDWVQDAGFEAVSFHASPGVPGQWQGVAPATVDHDTRQRLRERLAAFSTCEIHAPFSAMLTRQDPNAAVEKLAPVVAFAGDVGASVVTVHAKVLNPPEHDNALWQGALARLDAMAGEAGVVIGMETLQESLFGSIEWVKAPRRTNIAVTLDVGHLYLDDPPAYQSCGTVGGMIRSLGDLMVHMHVHDYDGTFDHIEVGTGRIDFDSMLRGMADVGYRGFICLELNPDRVSPEGMRRSRDFLRQRIAELNQG